MPGKRPDDTYGRPYQKPETDGLLKPGFPGQLGLLAQQMNNGFGGGLLAQRGYLNKIYDPVQMQAPVTLGGGDPKVTDTTAITTTAGGTGDAFELDPRMKRWESIFYNLPDGPARLQALQEGFKRAGYL